MEKAGQSAYYELVTQKNLHYRQAVKRSYEKERELLKGIMFPREKIGDPLENVENGTSVYLGINYQKLPHYVNWNANENGRRDQWQKPV